MPSPLPRLLPRSQKASLIIASLLLLLLVCASVFIIYQRRRPIVTEINSTQLLSLGESPTVKALNVDGDRITLSQPLASSAGVSMPAWAGAAEISTWLT